MKNRFVLMIDEATKEQQDIVTEFFRDKTGYWHWFKDSWLITDVSGEWSVAKIRDKVQELVPGVSTLVLKVDSGESWAAYGQISRFDWLHKTWK